VSVQIIVYSLLTGRPRYVVDDPVLAAASAIKFLSQVTARPGEGKIVYTKKGPGQDDVNSWQAAVNAVTGKSCIWGADNGDTYAVIDSGNNIMQVGIGTIDPVCDSAPIGGRILLAPAGCSPQWTFTPPDTFTPPV
jgi:hypothetical protein